MRCVWFMVVAGAVGSWAGQGSGAPPSVSTVTTYYTSPLRADGTVDYVEAINGQLSRGVTVQNNAAVVLMRLFGGDPARRARVLERLGLTPSPAVVLREADLAAEPAGFDDAQRGPWTSEKWPAVAAWLKRLEGGLAVAVEASRRERHFMPMVGERAGDPLLTIQLPHLNVMGSIVRVLQARAMLRLGSGDAEGFRSDAVALVRLGRLTSHAATEVERLVARRAEEAGLTVIRVAVSGGDVTGAGAELLLTELRRAPDWFEDSGLAERTFALDLIQVASVRGVPAAVALMGPPAGAGGGGGGGGGGNSARPAGMAGHDWDGAMRDANAWYQRVLEARALPSYADRARELGAIRRELGGIEANAVAGAASSRVEDRALVLSVSRMAQATEDDARLRAQRVVTETALALASFRAKTGEYPAHLGELVPICFAREPADVFTDRPLDYSAGGGGYVLSSAAPADRRSGRMDDLTIRVGK